MMQWPRQSQACPCTVNAHVHHFSPPNYIVPVYTHLFPQMDLICPHVVGLCAIVKAFYLPLSLFICFLFSGVAWRSFRQMLLLSCTVHFQKVCTLAQKHIFLNAYNCEQLSRVEHSLHLLPSTPLDIGPAVSFCLWSEVFPCQWIASPPTPSEWFAYCPHWGPGRKLQQSERWQWVNWEMHSGGW